MTALPAAVVHELKVAEPTTTTTTEPPPTTEPPTTTPPPAPEPAKVKPAPTTTAPPDPAPEAAPAPTGSGSVSDAIATYFGDGLYDQAWRVSGCESGHNPDAVSPGGGNYGLFQINTAHKKSFPAVTGHPWSDVLDPYLNAEFARWLYDQSGGWGPWSCRWAA